MNRVFLLCVFTLGFAGCESKYPKSSGQAKPGSTSSWYSVWISEDQGEQFHSELSLSPGEAGTVSIPSATSLVVGYVVEKGYEISKDPGTIFMGTSDAPHAVSGSPGTWKQFETINGSVTVRLENASTIATRLAIYTKPKT